MTAETLEQAEWALKTTAERTERFEPPMWEEIEDDYLYKFYINQKEFNFYINKFTDCVYIYNLDDTQVVYGVFDEPATKENYIKACEIVRDLFKGGEMTIFDFKPTIEDYNNLCAKIGFDTVYYNRNYAKTAQTINIFFGDDSLDWFVYGARIAQYTINPYKPYNKFKIRRG